MATKSPERKKAKQSERTRARLIEAATRLFAEKGARDTSVQAIAEAAGISRGSIFWHFGSKEGLLFAVVDSSFGEWEAEVLAPLLGKGSGPVNLREVVEAHLQFVRGNPEIGRLFFVLLFEALGPHPELLEPYARLYERFRSYGRTWLARAAADGRVRADLDPESASTAILGALGGIHYQWHLDPGRVDVAAVHEQLARILESGFAAPPDASS